MNKQIVKCPFCTSSSKNPREITTYTKYSYLVCDNCGGGILTPTPTKKELASLYSDKSYYKALAENKKSKLINALLNLKVNKLPYEWVLSRIKGKSVLDVGPGNGEFLLALKNGGYKVQGVDISRVAAAATNERIGKDVVKVGEFPKVKFREKFDIISFWHVLEHVDSPVAYLKKAASLLSKNGVVVGEVPNFDSVALQRLGKDYNWIMVPEHGLYFSQVALRETLLRAGFNRVEFAPTPRALTNLWRSVDKRVRRSVFDGLMFPLLALFFVPAVVMVYLASFIGKGEVLRFAAYK